jgi:toxin secretion/phage lysis holin
MLENILSELQNNTIIYTSLILIIGDTVLGFLRSCKEKTINSSIGIAGVTKKTSIIIALIIAFFIDLLLDFNMIGFIPENIRDFVKIQEIGILEIFGILFIVFESLSILKNLDKLNVPIPGKLKSLLEKLLKEITSENDNS